MYTAEQIEEMIYEYHWRKNVLLEEGYELDSNSTAQYGVESTMPKAQGGTSDKVLDIVTRNDVIYRILYKHLEVVSFIDKYEHHIDNDKNLNILYEIKKGKRPTEIKKIMNIGRTNFESRMTDIVNVYLNEQDKHNKHNQQDKHNQRYQH
ncbi:hypothetical protein [Staphylococcus carnosus]|uniref:Phage protein n=1 Tax=Staphylococcus carnosus TaxID=1281 RepID=A0AAJ0JMV8_STACA|nr:hypothetical protein [Staphylococcus carnosus]KKB24744.1 hypothetical protein VV61_09005 [Staphylococcus carnosus]POA05246.1 hypothetical protein CD153_03090 [Staphylococcus carnosus]QQS85830.1 hypothetical protein I6J04_03280 [Staphylococcus carnosus]QRQ05766.1 hypothetical protein I6J34_03620 [Staphylococcus carnosus]UTB82239.1 hypothetical protein A2I67_02535 [Staphylococcus carnosus]